MAEKIQLPALTDLFNEDLKTVYKTEELNLYLSQEPPASWIKTHPFVKSHKYLPIDKIELMLRKIFKRYRIEVMKTGMLLNSIEVHVRVHFFNPVTQEWDFHDGVGACEIQTQSKTGPLKLDMSNINNGAVTMALPIAKTVAVKDACDHFGPLFGANLNRKDTISFKPDEDLKKRAAESMNEKLQKLKA